MRPQILVTNDDGITAKGINCLVQAIKHLGDITVVAPDGPRSAQSNAITVHDPLRYWKQYEEPGVVAYRCNGTPSDCVKVGAHSIMKKSPDLLVSGINHGSNTSVNVIYSGTMGAAFDGCMMGIDSIGLSLCSHDPDADFTEALKYSVPIVEKVLREGLPHDVCLNVNFPYIPQLRGLRVARQCRGRWLERFEERVDPLGRKYSWLTGEFLNMEPDATDTDEAVIAAGYGSVTPCHLDVTDYTYLKQMSSFSYDAEEV
ncbi:MAG: 5'/3'-nucleotidase SurE [Paludibacteraceae bacterium]|jgi:5'-nucleotidase|nr:5'/3'-nucleotidase SurE [Paludibacteraceae bacterium]MBQ4033560.1 5'/3'-nucleotidase SurE [Paludibacteraceae bacterium]MBQ6766279.1 5'/3'-nucleotidase SurE [Paludibacteraceae bacterium]